MKKNQQLTLVALIVLAMNLSASPGYVGKIYKTSTPPLIDGIVDDVEWNHTDIMEFKSDSILFVYVDADNPKIQYPDVPEGHVTPSSFIAKGMWDENFVYVSLDVTDEKVDNDHTAANPDYKGANDDGFDFATNFVETKTMLTLMNLGNWESWFLDITDELEANDFTYMTSKTESGWNAELKIPFKAFSRPTTSAGDTILFAPRYNDANGNVQADGENPTFNTREDHFFWGSSPAEKWNDELGYAKVILSDEKDVSVSVDIFNTIVPAFRVYPNPANDVILISNAELNENISVLNLVGQEVISSVVNAEKVELNVADLLSGAYFVRIGSTAQKIIIE